MWTNVRLVVGATRANINNKNAFRTVIRNYNVFVVVVGVFFHIIIAAPRWRITYNNNNNMITFFFHSHNENTCKVYNTSKKYFIRIDTPMSCRIFSYRPARLYTRISRAFFLLLLSVIACTAFSVSFFSPVKQVFRRNRPRVHLSVQQVAALSPAPRTCGAAQRCASRAHVRHASLRTDAQ